MDKSNQNKDLEQSGSARAPENKMGVMPVNRLLLSMSLPMMISMLVQALYNIVDSIFVAQICEDALTAVSLAFPIQNIMIALAGGTGVGVNALLSRKLGEGNLETARKVAHNGIFLALCNYLAICLIFGICFSRTFFTAQTDDLEIIAYGHTYVSIVATCSFGLFGQFIFERLLQSTGRTLFTMITQSTGAIINIILDPILIFGWFGLPEMGIAGAALATIIGQIIAMVMALIFNIKKNTELDFNMKGFRPNLSLIGQIYKVGVPSILMQSIGAVMNFGMNRILISFTSTATAVFGIYYKVMSFAIMPVFGLNNGMVPIIAYNYGAQKRKRIISTFKLAVLYAMILMWIGLAVFQLIPEQLLMMFNASAQMLEIGVPALRTISLHFVVAGFCIISGSALQAMGRGMSSLVISAARQLLVLLPSAYILGKVGGLYLIWWSFPLAEVASLACSIVMIQRLYRQVVSRLPE
ncbi:MAG: MATE family efflux transporter [Butyricicoccaceae bacterium]